MLSTQLLLRQQLKRITCVLKNSRCSSKLAVDPDLTGSSELRLSSHKPKKPKREPFAKNLFVGKFDTEFLAYPEPQTHDRHRDFFEWLKPIEDYINEHVDPREIDRTQKIPNEVYEELRRLGVLRAAVDEEYGGIGLNNSEYTKLVETVSAVPVLGTYLIKRASITRLIKSFGSEQQKSFYLPKIATGQLSLSLCFSESPSGTLAEQLESKAILDDSLTGYTINGRKTYVFDAVNADFFVVLALNAAGDPFVENETFEAFLVPSNTEGIVIGAPLQMLGQQGSNFCEVTFNNVWVPKENKFGNTSLEAQLFLSAIGDGKHNIGGQTIGILKRFLNFFTDHVIKSKDFNVKIQAHDSIHESIARVSTALYAMEAMTYLTTGMMDTFENQDCLLEQSLVAAHCTDSCIKMILLGSQLIGSASYCKTENFERLLRDALALNCYDKSAIDTKIYAALLGVQHAGVTVGGMVKKHRNPLFHPFDMIMAALKINIDEKLHLDDNLHPSLRVAAISLEKSVHNLRKCVQDILIQYGISLMGHKMELRRLADVIIEIYAMTAVCARASRSYCIGLRNGEDEVKIAMIYTYRTYEKVNLLVKELAEGDWANGDTMLKNIADSTFHHKSYFASHPLERTF